MPRALIYIFAVLVLLCVLSCIVVSAVEVVDPTVEKKEEESPIPTNTVEDPPIPFGEEFEMKMKDGKAPVPPMPPRKPSPEADKRAEERKKNLEERRAERQRASEERKKRHEERAARRKEEHEQRLAQRKARGAGGEEGSTSAIKERIKNAHERIQQQRSEREAAMLRHMKEAKENRDRVEQEAGVKFEAEKENIEMEKSGTPDQPPDS